MYNIKTDLKLMDYVLLYVQWLEMCTNWQTADI